VTKSLKLGNHLVPIDNILEVDIWELEKGFVTVKTTNGSFIISGFDALEVVWWFKPSSMEGKRLSWKPHAWAFHNLIAHPVVQILAWMNLKKQAIRFHDWTTPKPIGFK